MKIKVDYKNAFPKQEERALAFDLYIKGFNGCETVKYSRELSGQSETLKKLCATSVAFKTPIICAFDTNNYGIVKKSAGVLKMENFSALVTPQQ